MKKTRYTEEQIAFALRQAERGKPVAEVIRKMGITEPTFYLYGRLSRCKQNWLWSALVSCKHLSGITHAWGAQMGNPLAHASIAGRPRRPR